MYLSIFYILISTFVKFFLILHKSVKEEKKKVIYNSRVIEEIGKEIEIVKIE